MGKRPPRAPVGILQLFLCPGKFPYPPVSQFLHLVNKEVRLGEPYITISKNILACLSSVWPNFVTNEGIHVTEQGQPGRLVLSTSSLTDGPFMSWAQICRTTVYIWYQTETSAALAAQSKCQITHSPAESTGKNESFLSAQFFHVTNFLILLQVKPTAADGSGSVS